MLVLDIHDDDEVGSCVYSRLILEGVCEFAELFQNNELPVLSFVFPQNEPNKAEGILIRCSRVKDTSTSTSRSEHLFPFLDKLFLDYWESSKTPLLLYDTGTRLVWIHLT